MAGGLPPKKNTAYILYTGLIQQADTRLLKANPTLAAGDFKVSIDGGAFNNLTTLPTVTPAAGTAVKISLSAAEMNGDNIVVTCIDAAGAEWCDRFIDIQTSVRQIDDLAYPATSGRSLAVSAAGVVDANDVLVDGAALASHVAGYYPADLATLSIAEPAGAPAASATLSAKISYLYEVLRNKLTVAAGAKTFYNDAGAIQWTKVLSDDGVTYTEGEGS